MAKKKSSTFSKVLSGIGTGLTGIGKGLSGFSAPFLGDTGWGQRESQLAFDEWKQQQAFDLKQKELYNDYITYGEGNLPYNEWAAQFNDPGSLIDDDEILTPKEKAELKKKNPEAYRDLYKDETSDIVNNANPLVPPEMASTTGLNLIGRTGVHAGNQAAITKHFYDQPNRFGRSMQAIGDAARDFGGKEFQANVKGIMNPVAAFEFYRDAIRKIRR